MSDATEKEQEQSLLELIPAHNLPFEQSDDKKVTIIQPKFTNKFMVKYVMPRMKQPNFKVSLDEFGSHIWAQIDGQRTIGEIGENLQDAFGEKVDPLWGRLTQFFVQLNNLKFIRYLNYQPRKK